MSYLPAQDWSHQAAPSSHRAPELEPIQALRLHLAFFLNGLRDAIAGWKPTMQAIQNSKHLQRALTRTMITQLFLLSAVGVLDYLLLPAMFKKGRHDKAADIKLYYEIFLVYPVMMLSFLLSSSVYADMTEGEVDKPSRKTKSATGVSIYKALVVIQYFVTSFILERIPVIGPVLSFGYMCIVDTYYCFEYAWIRKGMNFEQRVRQVEERWSYAFGFGIPITVISWFGGNLFNLALFSLAYPSYIIMASSSHVHPLPNDPYKPANTTVLPGSEASSSFAVAGSYSSTLDPDSPACSSIPIRIWILYPVVWVNNQISQVLGSTEGYSSSNGPKKSADYNPYVQTNGPLHPAQQGFAAYGSAPPAASGGDYSYASRREAMNRSVAGRQVQPGGEDGYAAASVSQRNTRPQVGTLSTDEYLKRRTRIG